MSRRSPAPAPLIPGEQQIGKPVVDKPRERQRHAIAEQRSEPPLPRRQPPQRNRDIRADDEPSSFIGRMQAAPDVVERGTEVRQRIQLLVDVLELNNARAHQSQQLVALPVDAGVADGAAGLVVDGEIGSRHDRDQLTTRQSLLKSGRLTRKIQLA